MKYPEQNRIEGDENKDGTFIFNMDGTCALKVKTESKDGKMRMEVSIINLEYTGKNEAGHAVYKLGDNASILPTWNMMEFVRTQFMQRETAIQLHDGSKVRNPFSLFMYGPVKSWS